MVHTITHAVVRVVERALESWGSTARLTTLIAVATVATVVLYGVVR